ncbi:putative phage tail protein [Paenibacillus kandeliae]|uniref:putative phage tail protein n=1 Tax=Paenibacillus kandeliae TaxID=3231269 RepID=UPI00345950C1
MIPLRYREVLPPYWYEDSHAEQHFALMEKEIDERADQILGAADQYVLQRATLSLPVWEWMYFHKAQQGTYEQRREAIQQKRLAKRPFTIPTLRLLAGKYGHLVSIQERFLDKQIDFVFAAGERVDLDGLYKDFEYIRPVHINKHTPILSNPAEVVSIGIQAYYHDVDFPICGLEMSYEEGTNGQLVGATVVADASGHYFGIDSPIAGLETTRGEE